VICPSGAVGPAFGLRLGLSRRPNTALGDNETRVTRQRKRAFVSGFDTTVDICIRDADLRAPPGNRLEPLKGDRAGQHSIRVNDQFRICFVWTQDGATNVELTDYH